MRSFSLCVSLGVLLMAALPLGCTNDAGGPAKGSGGAGSGGKSGGSGGNSSGGSGTGGCACGSGGYATGGASGGSGGNAGSGGSAVGGASATGGTTGGDGGRGGSATGGTTGGDGGSGGSATGGAGGEGGGGGTAMGGTSGGGAGGSTSSDGGPDVVGDDGGGPDEIPAGTCTDKKQNNLETDVDCGGGECPKCGAGKKCEADGDCSSGSCVSKKCADPFAADGTVTPTGNRWQIALGTTVLFEVGTDQAAMITAFSIDGTNFLVMNNASNGSVFWTAPQSDWNWPPPAEMDSAAYTPSSANNVLTMTGPVGSTDKLSITKKFWGNVKNQAVTIEYTIKNGGTTAVQKAPWEITRVYPGGLSFFPNAETPVVLPGTNNSFLAVPFTTAAGAAWFKYPKEGDTSWFTQDIKGGADSLEGWAAHINCGAGLVQACPTTGASAGKSIILIKQWPDTTTQAPAEKEVEIYANAGHNYVEFEQQGDYQSIPAGGTITWTMHWLLRYLPSTVAPTAGSAALLDWVRGELL
jgi:hypothetical protein